MQLVTPSKPLLKLIFPAMGRAAAWIMAASSLMASAAESVRVSWAANSERNISGYEVRFGTASQSYTRMVDAGNKTEVVIDGLESGVVHYFAVRAYNTYGLRGPLSAEAVYGTPDPELPPNGLIASPASNGMIVAGESVEFSASASDPNQGDTLTYRWQIGDRASSIEYFGRNPGAIRFPDPGVYQVTLHVTDSTGLWDPAPESRTITVLPAWSVIPRAAWRLKFVDSEEKGGYAAAQSFDGNPSTFWHTRWTSSKPSPPPHQIQIDLGERHHIRGFQYLPRQDGNTVGTIDGFKFYVSLDGKNWGKPIASGKFARGTREKRVFGKTKLGRYIKLVGVSEQNGYSDCSVAELNVIEGPPPNRAPVAKARSVSTTRNRPVSFQLSATDADRNPLTYQIVSKPKHGALKGSAPSLTYQPKSGFTGSDTFTYRVSDGMAKSKTVSVKITVKSGGSSAKSASIPLAARSAETTRATQGRVIMDGLSYLTLTIEKPSIPDGLKRRVEVSPNLVDWFSGREHTTVVLETNRRLTVRDNTPITPGKKRHIRVRTVGK